MRWIVDMAYPLWEDGEDAEYDEIAQKHGSKGSESSGAGFDLRDIQYTFDRKVKAEAAAEEMMTLGSTEYANVHREPRSTFLYLLMMREYKEAWRWLLKGFGDQ